MTDDELANYDEFGMLKVYADYEDIPWHGRPDVTRRSFDVGSGQKLSALVWGKGEPEIVLAHGNAQNAHTWDSVAMALDLPLVAVDLPGHGHSDWRDDHDYRPWSNAEALAAVISEAAPNLKLVVGMSLGGLTTIRLAAGHPELVPRAVIVDITPGVGSRTSSRSSQTRGAADLPSRPQPQVFESFEEMLQLTASVLPGRPVDSLRIGVLHNARRLEDGRWAWRYDLQRAQNSGEAPSTSTLWEDFSAIAAPLMLVRAGRSPFVHDEDAAEVLRRQPKTRIEVVDGASHSVQSDRPTVLAALIRDFVATTA
ncbi:MAG TPA: alpha/beta hydrolase [Acidimicrobiales bacterium]|jgi:pimeloyl-ACP methyl ester carboxylesterase|nr:alpha/beta hydrolase [Acidimicrobiales bacterium]